MIKWSSMWRVTVLGGVLGMSNLAAVPVSAPVTGTAKMIRWIPWGAFKSTKQLGRCAHAFSKAQIDDWAKLASKPQGMKEVKLIIGKMQLPIKYGVTASEKIMQDTFLRIAVKNGHMTSTQAEYVLRHLGKTPGLRGLLSKINSVNAAQVKGHMRELDIAISAQRRGFTPVELGRKYADGLKHADTDLDVLLRRGNKYYAIESKAYTGTVHDDMVIADAKSLLSFCKNSPKKTIPVFCFEHEPSPFALKWLEKNNVKCLIGFPDELATQLTFL